jgi:hypothetical protein
MSRLVMTLAAASLWVASSAHAQSPFTMRTSDGAVARIGAFHPSRSPTLAAAIRVFGNPTSRRILTNNDCQVDWRRVRLRIQFANFGGHGPGETTCSPSVGRAQAFTVRGSRFRTSAGLRVGDQTTSIRRLYPAAELRDGSWWLITAVSPFGDQSEYPVLRAIVSGGRVRAIAGWIGAAGE